MLFCCSLEFLPCLLFKPNWATSRAADAKVRPPGFHQPSDFSRATSVDLGWDAQQMSSCVSWKNWIPLLPSILLTSNIIIMHRLSIFSCLWRTEHLHWFWRKHGNFRAEINNDCLMGRIWGSGAPQQSQTGLNLSQCTPASSLTPESDDRIELLSHMHKTLKMSHISFGE